MSIDYNDNIDNIIKRLKKKKLNIAKVMVSGINHGMNLFKSKILKEQMTSRPGLKRPTGNLARSWRIIKKHLGKDYSVKLATDTKYAAIHQYGGTIRHPGGTPYVIIKNKGAVFMKKDGNYPPNTRYTRAHNITIPKRLHIFEEFQKSGNDIIIRAIQQKLKLALAK